MKKNILIVFGCAVLLLLSSSVYGAKGPYFSGSLGFATLGDTDMTFPEFERMNADTKEAIERTGGIYDVDFSYNAEFDTGTALSFAMGYDFGNNFRIEAEFAYQKNDLDKAGFRYYENIDVVLAGEQLVNEVAFADVDFVSGDISSLALMINGYMDFANTSAFTPFMTAGVGFAKVKNDMFSMAIDTFLFEVDEEYNLVSLDQSGSDTILAYQVGAGVGYAVSETFTLDFKYRFFATEDPEFGSVNMEYASHNFYVGFRKGF